MRVWLSCCSRTSCNRRWSISMDYKKYYRYKSNVYHIHFLNKNRLTKDEIKEICSTYGKVVSVFETSYPYGMRFVTFRTEEETINCIKGLEDSTFIELLPERKYSERNRKGTVSVSRCNENGTNEERNSISSEKFVVRDLTNGSFSDETEWEKFAKIDKDGNYCIHFYENTNLSQREIEDIFSRYGNVVSVIFGNKNNVDTKLRFVRYRTAAEVINCIKDLQNNKKIKILQQKHKNGNLATVQTEQSENKFNKKQTTESTRNSNSDQAEEQQESNLYCAAEEDTHVCNKIPSVLSYYKMPSLVSDNNGSESISHTEVEHREADTERYFQVQFANNLSASRKIIPLERVIVANIHENYGAAYILHLLEKYKPIAIKFVKTTGGNKVRYCTVYFKTVQDAIATEKELDNFCLSGKNLIVLRESHLTQEKL